MKCSIISGQMPIVFPAGTFFANGPDARSMPERPAHPLDGDGRVQRVRFERAGAVPSISSACVQTEHRKNENNAGRLLYRHTFGSGPRFSASLKHSANTNFVVHACRGLALWEGGHPYEMDPSSLETLGSFNMRSLARSGMPAATGLGATLDAALGLGGDAVCAHPRRDPATGTTAFMLFRHEPRGTRIRIASLPDGSFKPLHVREVLVPHFSIIHDFGITRDYYVFFAATMVFDWFAFFCGASMADCSRQTTGSTKMYLVHRWHIRQRPEVLDAGHVFSTHVVNAFQTARWVVADVVAMPRLLDPPRGMPDVRMMRFASRDGAVTSHVMCSHLTEFPTTAPAVQGLAYRFAYAASDPFGWTKIDTVSGMTWLCSCVSGPHAEPVFVPAPDGKNEDDGWLIGFAMDGDLALLCVADARTMTPTCVMQAPGVHAFTLHGCFIKDA